MTEPMMSRSNLLSAGAALRRLGFRQTIKGALIIGLLAGGMTVLQGAAYAASYPDQTARTEFVATLKSAPAVGVLYGETGHADTPAGYMVYRTVTVLGLVTSIWGLMTVTKLLRGQEEDGRAEIITAGNTTLRSASLQLSVGFGASLLVAYVITAVIIGGVGANASISMSPSEAMLATSAIFLPTLVFSALGFFVSQLSITRRRALFYGLVPLIVLFGIRAAGNTISDAYWLKRFTPFGWADLIQPVGTAHLVWSVPALLFALLFFAGAAYLVGKRDLGDSLIPESDSAKSHFFLLRSPLGFSLRQNSLLFAGWGVVTLAISMLIAAISNVAVDALKESPTLGGAVATISGGTNDLQIAFLGTGMMFTVIVLLIMAAVSVSIIRGSEAKNYLDNLLVQPIRRSGWFTGQLLVITVAAAVISVLTALVTWAIARAEGIAIDLPNTLFVGLALTGTVIFTLGFGALLYGLLPRIASIGMYVVLTWSFLIDIIGSVVKLNDSIVKSSLFHYVSLSPGSAPDWSTFAWLAGLGIAMGAAGVVAFAKRDIIAA